LEQIKVTDGDGDMPMQTNPANETSDMLIGVSWESQKPIMKGHCDLCGEGFPHPSMVAYVFDESPEYPFAKVREPVVFKAVFRQVVNVYDDRKILSACVWCLQERHAPSPRHTYIAEVERDGKKCRS
jgi:hypothetical protein